MFAPMLELIKSAIKKFGGQTKFAKEAKIRQATLSDFLHGKDIKLSTLNKIMYVAGLEITSNQPNQLMQRDYVIIDGTKYHVGDSVSDEVEVAYCFGSTHTSKQGVILKNTVTDELELIVG